MQQYFDFLNFLSGDPVPVEIKNNVRGKNICLRIDSHAGQVVLSLPHYVSIQEGINFLQSKSAWVQKSFKNFIPKQKFVPNLQINLLGVSYILLHNPQAREGVQIHDNHIYVSGELEHFSRRVGDFIKRKFLEYAFKIAHAKAQLLNVKVYRVNLKDQKTRWGSCTSEGNISLSWRLALAPLEVAEYVIAHEVCHLREMNHGVNFWNLIYEVYNSDIAAAKLWLKENAKLLYAYE